ncbi:MAG: SH3 domain-containing protein, partial [Pseudomonadota bacterium]
MNSISYGDYDGRKGGTSSSRWNRASPKIGVLVAFLLMTGTALAQVRYERAKVPLVGTVLTDSPVRKEPQPDSTIKGTAPAGMQIRIKGRQGSWFQVEATVGKQPISGWLPGSAVKILGQALEQGAIKGPSQPEEPVPGAAASLSGPTTRPPPPVSTRSAIPVRLLPRAGYAFGAKSVQDQFRVGADVLLGLSSSTEIGLAMEAGFRHFTLVSGGPVIQERLRWPRLGSLRTSVYGGFSVFY